MGEKILERTASLCPVCLTRLPAQIVAREHRVYLEKICPEHGAFSRLIWQDEDGYLAWLRQGGEAQAGPWERPALWGCPFDCGICQAHLQDACCVLLELTGDCDQHCPYCYAASGEGADPPPDLSQITSMLDFLLQRSQGRQPYNLQLSGGEPTLRRDLPQIIALARDKGFPYVQLNTNGKRLAGEARYAETLAAAGLSAVFLQFDGLDDQVYQTLRGEKLLDIKMAALAACRRAKLPVVLAFTAVSGVNMEQIGPCFFLMLENLPHIRGLHLQPVCYSGRHPGLAAGPTLDECMRQLTAQSRGLLRREHFSPLATAHPLCAFQGSFIYDGQKVVSVGSGGCCGGMDRSRRHLAVNWQSGHRDGAWCCSFPTWLDQRVQNGFSLSAMAFQDGLSLDLQRLRRCRVYVARPDRSLIPFCALNLTASQGKTLYSRKKDCDSIF
ncbi:MAG: radical SAM protein [Firmicutes bacterium]|nr:radical SAM protein [Bacillota bacterium]